ncbi:MAG TPA: Tim44-like domain-containing protein [Ramlibacter sp.]|uniref:Tim44 domain-containing protein n=1 Tax=Ramlibacter sp. TaxID=1917967 RepID=UPI002D80A213|nr:Tim44-like domain-containing protein [Ramlibacter sp.]HET8748933.1 Tim44-like domain-containing protein [Ramlibacter sp.]
MRKTLALFALVLTLGMTLALDAEARRLGGARSSGMQRQSVTAPAPTPGGTHSSAVPGQGAAATGAPAAGMAGTAAAATQKRSWMGPVAGLAAGLGIAALASHFGFGEALANVLTMALLAMAVLFVIGLVMRKRAAAQGGSYAGAGAAGPAGGMFRQQPPAQDVAFRNAQGAAQRSGGSLIGSGLAGPGADAAPGGRIPAGFDVPAFERTARDQFMALQAANDARDLDRLRDYLSPEMFEAVRADIAERGDAQQKVEVFGLNAQVLEVVEEGDSYVVSVRFTGSVRERADAVPEDLDEVWHLVKPRSGFGGWVIAGIQQAK